MVFSSIYTLVLTLTCSPPCPRCSVQPIAVAFRSTHCRCGSFTSMPRLAFACLIYALPLHCVTKPRLASATLCCSMLCLCNSFLRKTMPLRTFAIPRLCPSSPFHATAIQRYSMPMRFASSLCLCVCFAFLFSSLFALPLHLLPSCCFTMPMLRLSYSHHSIAVPLRFHSMQDNTTPSPFFAFHFYAIAVLCDTLQY